MVTPTARQITITAADRRAAIAWLTDCGWPDIDPEDLEDVLAEYTDAEVVLTVNHHHAGGWQAFLDAGATS